jgi:hypothetical protein
MLRYFKAQGIHVCLVALAHDDEEVAHAAGLTSLVDALHVVRIGVVRAEADGIALGVVPLNVGLRHDVGAEHPPGFADIELVRPVAARCGAGLLFRDGTICDGTPLDTLPFVLDMVDVDSFKWEGLAEASPGPRAWLYRREARGAATFRSQRHARGSRNARGEHARGRGAQEPRQRIRAGGPAQRVDVEAFRTAEPPSARPEVVFTGVFSYRPNETGALWLIEQVWPLVRQRQPDAHLTLVGTGPGQCSNVVPRRRAFG